MKKNLFVLAGLVVGHSVTYSDSVQITSSTEGAEARDVPVDSLATVGWSYYIEDGVERYDPPAPVVIVSQADYTMLWHFQELAGLAQIRTTDAALDAFMRRLENPEMAEVNLSLLTNQEGIEYALGCLAAKGTIAPADIAARLEEILSGVVR